MRGCWLSRERVAVAGAQVRSRMLAQRARPALARITGARRA
jgi:hypothetical protein